LYELETCFGPDALHGTLSLAAAAGVGARAYYGTGGVGAPMAGLLWAGACLGTGVAADVAGQGISREGQGAFPCLATRTAGPVQEHADLETEEAACRGYSAGAGRAGPAG